MNTKEQYEAAAKAIMSFRWIYTPQGDPYWHSVYRNLEDNADKLPDTKNPKYREATDADIPKVKYPDAEFSHNGKDWFTGKLILKHGESCPYYGIMEARFVSNYRHCRIKVNP